MEEMIQFIPVGLWSTFCIGLAIVWVSTLWHLWNLQAAWSALAMLLLVPLLFIVEGLELGVTYLLGRETTTMNGKAAREIGRVKANRSAFFADRQVFVVAIISLLTLVNSFNSIYVPYVGRVEAYHAAFWFSLVWVTLSVLWFAQVPGKLLALHDASRFMGHSWHICALVRWVGALKVTSPSYLTFHGLRKLLLYPKNRRDVPPISSVFYDYTAGRWIVTLGDPEGISEEDYIPAQETDRITATPLDLPECHFYYDWIDGWMPCCCGELKESHV